MIGQLYAEKGKQESDWLEDPCSFFGSSPKSPIRVFSHQSQSSRQQLLEVGIFVYALIEPLLSPLYGQQ